MFLEELLACLMTRYHTEICTGHWLSVRICLGTVGIPCTNFHIPLPDNLDQKELVKVIEDLPMLCT